jgi:hypothetical protein
LIEVFDALDVCATYNKPTRRLQLAATVTPELVANYEKNDRPRGRSLNCDIAGAGLIPKPATGPAAQGTLAEKRIVAAIAHRIEELWPLGREVGWLRELGGGDGA